MNLGVDGKNPANYIDFLSYMPLHPGDTVAVVLYDNDIHLSKEACEITKRQSKHFSLHYPKLCEDYLTGLENPKNEQGILALINLYLKDFAVIKVLKEALYQTPLAKIYYRQDFQNRWLKIDQAENRWIVSAIEVMKNIVEKKGGRFLLFYYPNTNNIQTDDPRHKVWTAFGLRLNQELGLKLHDPYPYFISNAPSRTMVWSLTDKHPSCQAHDLMADFVAKTMFQISDP